MTNNNIGLVAPEKIRAYLQQSKLTELFNEIGWDHLDSAVNVEVNGQHFTLEPIAEKKACKSIAALRMRTATSPITPHGKKSSARQDR